MQSWRNWLRKPNEKRKGQAPRAWPLLIAAVRRERSAARARADHEGVVGVLGDLPPEIFVIAERHDRVPDLLEVGILGRGLGIHFVRGLEAGLHDVLREWAQLDAVRDQALQRGRIARIVARRLLDVDRARGGPKDRL